MYFVFHLPQGLCGRKEWPNRKRTDFSVIQDKNLMVAQFHLSFSYSLSLNHPLKDTYEKKNEIYSSATAFRPIKSHSNSYMKKKVYLQMLLYLTLHSFFRTTGLVFIKFVNSISLSPCSLMVRPSSSSQAREL